MPTFRGFVSPHPLSLPLITPCRFHNLNIFSVGNVAIGAEAGAGPQFETGRGGSGNELEGHMTDERRFHSLDTRCPELLDEFLGPLEVQVVSDAPHHLLGPRAS